MSIAYSTSNVTVSEDAPSAAFIVKRSGTASDLAEASSVSFETADDSAIAGTGYTATSGELTFAAGVTQMVLRVEILPEAYQGAIVTSFLLRLTGYGSATGTIVPCAPDNTTQIYTLVPEDGDGVAVPSDTTSNENINWQADVSGFGAASGATVDMPLAYLRLGHARADMNDYERIVLNSDAYQPAWNGHKNDGTPIESASMMNMMLPRGLDRRNLSDDEVDAAKKDNAHLDGAFLYSDKNFVVTIKGSQNTVIQGDQVLYVGGDVRNLIMGNWANCYYWETPGYLRYMEGMDTINGKWWEYSITSAYSLSIASEKSVGYTIGYSFNATAGADMAVSTGAKYDVGNSIGMTVKGLEGAISADVLGAFDVKLAGKGHTANQKSIEQSASERITFSINAGLDTAWTEPVQAIAASTAVAAALATTPGWIAAFTPQGDFYKNATVEGLSNKYKAAFTEEIPDLMATFGALAFVQTLLSAYLQKAFSVTPPLMPKIEMDPTKLVLWANAASNLVLTAEGLTITAPMVEINAGAIEMEAAGTIEFTAPLLDAIVDQFDVAGNIAVGEEISVMAGGSVLGSLYVTNLETS